MIRGPAHATACASCALPPLFNTPATPHAPCVARTPPSVKMAFNARSKKIVKERGLAPDEFEESVAQVGIAAPCKRLQAEKPGRHFHMVAAP